MIAQAPIFTEFNTPLYQSLNQRNNGGMNYNQNSLPPFKTMPTFNYNAHQSTSPYMTNTAGIYEFDITSHSSSPNPIQHDKQNWTNINTKPTMAQISRLMKSKPKEKSKDNQRKKFSPEEDEKLKSLVEKMGSKKWDSIAKEMPGRTGRQCRDRYKNYLIPGFFNGQWSKEEDDLLKQKYAEYGSQWSKITQFFTQRSANSLKNRWNYFVSRHLHVEPCQKIRNIYDNYGVNNNNKDKNDADEVLYESIINFTPTVNPLVDAPSDFFEMYNMNDNDEINFKDDCYDFPFILKS